MNKKKAKKEGEDAVTKTATLLIRTMNVAPSFRIAKQRLTQIEKRKSAAVLLVCIAATTTAKLPAVAVAAAQNIGYPQ